VTRYLVTGATGQLGHELVRLGGAAALGLGRGDLDVTDQGAVAAVLDRYTPDVVINAAAYTAVDAAETDEAAARAGNVTGPAVLAAATAARGVGLVHVSTDYVFAGDATVPYPEDAPTDPRSVYGATKRDGELAVLAVHPGAYIVRTAWVYGAHGPNFVKTMLQLQAERETVSVVDDQTGSPTWAAELAAALLTLAAADAAPGVYHYTNAGQTTWYGLARAVFAAVGADPDRVLPTTTENFPRPAPRPAYSVLGRARWAAAGLPEPTAWDQALVRALADEPEAWR